LIGYKLPFFLPGREQVWLSPYKKALKLPAWRIDNPDEKPATPDFSY